MISVPLDLVTHARRAPALTVAAVVAWSIYSLVISALLLKLPISPDDAVYDYLAWVWLEGGTLYVDAADQNWP